MVERGVRFSRVLVIILLGIVLSVPSFAPVSEGVEYRSEPIIVEGNDGFAEAGFAGSGTAEDPYVLSEVSLNASLEMHGIRISNTTAHFRIQGCTVHDAFSPDRDPLNISASGSGILLTNVTNAVIEDYLGNYNVRGITVVSSSKVVINGSRFIGNIEAGVHLMDCLDGGVEVTNNAFSVYTRDDGVLLERCLAVKVINNTIEGGRNGIAVRAGGLGLGGHLLEENQLTDQSEYGILLDGSAMATGDLVLNNTVSGAGASGIKISFGTGEMVSGNEISWSLQGIEVGWSENEVSGNALSNNTLGISVGTDADRNLISGNMVQDGAFGILIGPSQGNEISHNTILRMTMVDSSVGIYLGVGAVKDARIEGNDISLCNVGLRAATVSGQEISGLSVVNNSITGSIKEGAYLLYTVSSNLFNNSLISGGGNGIYLGAGCRDLVLEGNEMTLNDGAGIYVRDADDNTIASNLFVSNALEGIYLNSGSGNVVHGNALLFNKDSGRQYSSLRPQAFCGEAGNDWSLGTGNLWADWLTPDSDEDGIVDIPYNISGGCQDPFPLTYIPDLTIPEDIVPPTVAEWAPQGISVEEGSEVRITFSEDMEEGSVQAKVNDLSVNGSWDDRSLVLEVVLDFQTEYTVTVSGRDLAGNNMSEFQWTFRTESPNATVDGRVVNEDGGPLSGALVVSGEEQVLTDENGLFSLLLAPGDHTLSVSAEGFKEAKVQVQVLPGQDAELGDVVLVRESGSAGDYMLIALGGMAILGAVLLLWYRHRR